jgi:hypothetical protein
MKQAQVCFPSFAETLGMVTIEVDGVVKKARCQYQYRLGAELMQETDKWLFCIPRTMHYLPNGSLQ